jgi:hypothetical protein
VGTSIDVLIPRPPRLDAVDITVRLNSLFAECESDLQVIKKHACYSIDCEPWALEYVPAHADQPGYFYDEGPYGFNIRVYVNLVSLGQLERFGRLHCEDSPVATTLQRMLTKISHGLVGLEKFACVAGGMGDSDCANDMAYYQASTFQQVSDWLHRFLGEPAQTWAQLNCDAHRWALVD